MVRPMCFPYGKYCVRMRFRILWHYEIFDKFGNTFGTALGLFFDTVPNSRQRLVFGRSVAPCVCFCLSALDVNFHLLFVGFMCRSTIWEPSGSIWGIM